MGRRLQPIKILSVSMFREHLFTNASCSKRNSRTHWTQPQGRRLERMPLGFRYKSTGCVQRTEKHAMHAESSHSVQMHVLMKSFTCSELSMKNGSGVLCNAQKKGINTGSYGRALSTRTTPAQLLSRTLTLFACHGLHGWRLR